jgi:DNA-binding transcriptional MocR family regulator
MKTNTVIFDEAPPSGHINFAVGQPSADLLPVELIRTAAEDFLRHAHPLNMNYGVKQGDAAFRQSLADFLTRHYGVATQPESLFVTAGSSHALDLVCTAFTRAGDTVFVEEPSYHLAFQIFRDHGLNIVGIPVDEHGMNMEKLEDQLALVKPALVYTIPSFSNPTGQSLSEARRKRLMDLSVVHDFMIAADEVYQLLSYYEAPPTAFGSLAEAQGNRGTIVSLGSFSKILAPGLRLGWIQTAPNLIDRLLANGVVSSGGSLNHFTSQIVRHAIDLGLQDQHLQRLRSAYRGRLEAMHHALREHLADKGKWQQPQGGYFYWLELNQVSDTRTLRKKAEEYLTGFQPGPAFSSYGALQNRVRLSFAHYHETEIHTGVGRLASLLEDKAN